MNESLGKMMVAIASVFMIGLFVVVAAPVRAGDVAEENKALQQELKRLGSQNKIFFEELKRLKESNSAVQKEMQWLRARDEAREKELGEVKGKQIELKKDAQAARAKLPSFIYRPGRGLTIRAADRSWQASLGMVTQWHFGLFPDGDAKSTKTDSDEGPSQFSSQARRLRLFFRFSLLEGLYTFSLVPRFDTSRHSALGGGIKVNFDKFSPYYPSFNFGSVRPMYNLQGVNWSSTSGTTLERPLLEGVIFRSGSTEGMGLFWRNVPFGVGRIRNFDIVAIHGYQFSDKTTGSPLDVKGLVAGLLVEPFSKVKNKWVRGLNFGFSYVTDVTDRNRGRGAALAASASDRPNRFDIYNIQISGRRQFWIPNMGWNVGPYRFGFAYGHVEAERDFRSLGDSKEGDTKVDYLVIRNGLFVWSPKGFLTGSERGPNSVMVAYTFMRHDFDNGSGFMTRNDFDGMRRYHVGQHAVALKWFQRSNIIWTVEANIYKFNKMNGSGDAATTRRRAGIRSDGGFYTAITLGARMNF